MIILTHLCFVVAALHTLNVGFSELPELLFSLVARTKKETANWLCQNIMTWEPVAANGDIARYRSSCGLTCCCLVIFLTWA